MDKPRGMSCNLSHRPTFEPTSAYPGGTCIGHMRFADSELSRDYGRVCVPFYHDLSDHPLVSMEALAELARKLEKIGSNHVQYRRASVPLTGDIDRPHLAPLDKSLDHILEDFGSSGAYLHLKSAHVVPEYRALMNEILAPVERDLEPRMRFKVISFFVTAPGAITPYHMDREINFLFQLRGKKHLKVWDPHDTRVLREEDLETLFARPDLPRPGFREEFTKYATHLDFSAGRGIHIPFFAPHYAEVLHEVSVAMAVTFHTRQSDSIADAYRINHRLRRLGIRPRAVGDAPWLDAAKSLGGRGLRSVEMVRKRLRRLLKPAA